MKDLKEKCIITIPVYRQPTEWEEKSFRQCLNVLCHHEIVILTYEGLPIQRYNAIAKEYNYNIRYEYFDKNNFSSVKAYNHLMLSKEFYERFLDYEYILIYQLDAWVFRDELDYWCNKGYDYIGAPLFQEVPRFSGNYVKKMICVGNGGFCLRKTSYCLQILKHPKRFPFLRIKEFWNKLVTDSVKPWSRLYLLLRYNTVRGLEEYGINEDKVFSCYKTYGVQNIPNTSEAAFFSFEMFPSYLFNETHRRLPFGCHAFEKYEYDDFWSKYIK